MTQLVRKHAHKVASVCVCVQLKRGLVKLCLLFHFILHAVQIIALESMRGNIKEDKTNLFTDVVVSFNPVAE